MEYATKGWTVYEEVPRKKKYFKPVLGHVYLIKLYRSQEGRFNYKIGFTENNVQERLKSAQTWVASASLVNSWPAVSTWEDLARSFVADQCGAPRVQDSEVVEGSEDEQVIDEKLDEFFQRLPNPKTMSGALCKGISKPKRRASREAA